MSEWDLSAAETLLWRMEEGDIPPCPIWTDLRTLPWTSFADKVDVITGGFPCQPFSQAGKRKGVEDPRHLFPHIERGISITRPRLVFLENVPGILSSLTSDGEPVALYVLKRLETLGYKATAGIFSAGECRHPHQRKRVFFAAVSDAYCARIPRHNGKLVTTGHACGPDHIQPKEVRRVARFGEEQHIWEYSRTYDYKDEAAYQSPMDGATHGDTSALGCSVKDLNTYFKQATRACGNGVVPDTSEVAARTLFAELGILTA
jgi:site-specific DNA-cytosine methylase